jgi:hypothetical protein
MFFGLGLARRITLVDPSEKDFGFHRSPKDCKDSTKIKEGGAKKQCKSVEEAF